MVLQFNAPHGLGTVCFETLASEAVGWLVGRLLRYFQLEPADGRWHLYRGNGDVLQSTMMLGQLGLRDREILSLRCVSLPPEENE